MWSCYLCQEETVYTKYYCVSCEKIKRIINVYSKDKVLDILEKVCLRKKEKLQNYKIQEIKKELEENEPKKVKFDDTSYMNPNKELMEDLKNKIKNI